MGYSRPSWNDPRGNAEARRRRKMYLLNTYGDGYSAPCAFCEFEVDWHTITADRYPILGADGGSYRRSNIRPACLHCNSSHGAQEGARRRAQQKASTSMKRMTLVVAVAAALILAGAAGPAFADEGSTSSPDTQGTQETLTSPSDSAPVDQSKLPPTQTSTTNTAWPESSVETILPIELPTSPVADSTSTQPAESSAGLTVEVFWKMPNGGTPDQVTWPQTHVAIPDECGVWFQVDTYHADDVAALVQDGLLLEGEDWDVVLSWRFTYGGDCTAPATEPRPVPSTVAPAIPATRVTPMTDAPDTLAQTGSKELAKMWVWAAGGIVILLGLIGIIFGRTKMNREHEREQRERNKK